jgi:excisionase family DNA binding protein
VGVDRSGTEEVDNVNKKQKFGEFLTRKQAAQFLGVAPKTVYNWVAAGHLTPVPVEGYRWPKLRRSDLEALQKAAAEQGVSLVHQFSFRATAERKRESAEVVEELIEGRKHR